jgi:hypothetical protein
MEIDFSARKLLLCDDTSTCVLGLAVGLVITPLTPVGDTPLSSINSQSALV